MKPAFEGKADVVITCDNFRVSDPFRTFCSFFITLLRCTTRPLSLI